MRAAYEQLKAWEEIVISSEVGGELSRQSVNSDGHGKEILTYKILLIYYNYYTNQNAARYFSDWIEKIFS